MHIILSILVGFSLYLSASLSIAQTDSIPGKSHSYFGLSVGLASVKTKDDLVMPVRYTGTNVNTKISYWHRKPQVIQEGYISAVIGGVKTKEAIIDNFGARFKEPRAQLYFADMGYMYLRKISFITSKKYDFFMGGNAYFLSNVRYNERWDNSAINYEGAFTPLSWTGRMERIITTKKKGKPLLFSYSLNFPVLTFVVRPEFSGVPDFLDHETNFFTDMFERGSWESFWGFPRIKSTLDFTMPLAEKNQMRFSYTWDYYSYQDPVKTQFAGHYFLFTLLTHL